MYMKLNNQLQIGYCSFIQSYIYYNKINGPCYHSSYYSGYNTGILSFLSQYIPLDNGLQMTIMVLMIICSFGYGKYPSPIE